MLPMIANFCPEVNLVDQQLTGKYALISFEATPDLLEKLMEAAGHHGYNQAVNIYKK
jgi:hypothetical protein